MSLRWTLIGASDIAATRLIPAMRALGHEVVVEPLESHFAFGGSQVILKLEGAGYVAGSDPRKDGQAVGF
jgi:gamma-glutamyltranspeptidase/glutathione hydrolase